MIEHLPPVGWADVTTKHDLAGLERRVDLRFTVLEKRIDDGFARIYGQAGAQLGVGERPRQLVEQQLDTKSS